MQAELADKREPVSVANKKMVSSAANSMTGLAVDKRGKS